ncbi:MAG: NAD-binding protein [Proteobacteria bacterium]|nr:NAD-binding protein [Pseudomonadota bacterium]
MAKGSDLDRVAYIVLHDMRGPVVSLVLVYTVGIIGMVLMPGPVVDGATMHMSIFHAFYFMAYTATTTGFGELPHEFSDAQRMWTIFCLYMSVIAWIYAIGAIIRLVQNPYFTQALAQRRFAANVQRLHDPFVVVCGFGDTGSLLARGLSDHRINGVIIDSDVERIKALGLRDYDVTMPGLCADASVPKNLQDAGIARPNCMAVVVFTDEALSLKIAVMTRLLNPAAKVICRSTTREHDEELRALGAVSIADPFESFARELSLVWHAPVQHALEDWLVGARGASMAQPIKCPEGRWVLCGYGRMGQWLYGSMQPLGMTPMVIDPGLTQTHDLDAMIVGLATRRNLEAAGTSESVGVIAATDSDTDNLAILLSARNLNPDAFLVVRQNHHENEVAFQAASADLIMQPSLVCARRILLSLISPLVQPFLDALEKNPQVMVEKTYPRLAEVFDDQPPRLWTVDIDSQSAPAVIDCVAPVELGTLLRHPSNRDRRVACVPLMIDRSGRRLLMPDDELVIEAGDRLLMCGINGAQADLEATLTSAYTLPYLMTGLEPRRSRVLQSLGLS